LDFQQHVLAQAIKLGGLGAQFRLAERPHSATADLGSGFIKALSLNPSPAFPQSIFQLFATTIDSALQQSSILQFGPYRLSC
jgi:hypothetical protein